MKCSCQGGGVAEGARRARRRCDAAMQGPAGTLAAPQPLPLTPSHLQAEARSSDQWHECTQLPQLQPTWMRMERKACTRSRVDGWKAVPSCGLNTMRLICRGGKKRGRGWRVAGRLAGGALVRVGRDEVDLQWGLGEGAKEGAMRARLEARSSCCRCGSSGARQAAAVLCHCVRLAACHAGLRPATQKQARALQRMFRVSSSSRRASSSVSFTPLRAR